MIKMENKRFDCEIENDFEKFYNLLGLCNI